MIEETPLHLSERPAAHPDLGAMITELEQYANSGSRVPILGASLAASESKQISHYIRRGPTKELVEVWKAVAEHQAGELPYKYMVSALTKYQLAREKGAGLR